MGDDKVRDKAKLTLRTSGAYEILALFILIVIAFAVNNLVNVKDNPSLRLFLSAAFAISVSIVFLVLFYRQDMLEPEPKKLIALMFLAGAALPILVVNPLLEGVFKISTWSSYGSFMNLIGYILVIGVIVELSKLLLVRYSIFLNKEFDEIVDGVVYMSVVGLGYATALNLKYVISAQGTDLLIGTIRMSTMTMLHASISGFIGFFLGRAKFKEGNKFGLSLGFLAAVIFWGIYHLIIDFSKSGLQFDVWKELLMVAAFSFTIMTVTVGLMRYSIKKEIKVSQGGDQ